MISETLLGVIAFILACALVVLRRRRIAERARSHRALAASEQRFQDVVYALADWVWEVDLDARYLYVSDSVGTMLGYEPAALIGRSSHELLPPNASSRVRQLIEEVVRTRRPFRDLESVVYDASGALRQTIISGTPMFDASGAVVGVRGVGRDLTAQKRLESEIARSHAQYRRLIDAAHEGICVVQDAKVHVVNPALLALVGCTEAEVLGMPFLDFIAPSDRSMLRERYERRVAGLPLAPTYAFRLLSRRGIRWCEIDATPIEWQERPATLSFVRDVTEQREMEDQLRRLATLVLDVPHVFDT